MADTPNSFKDPYWADLASAASDKLGLPPGLLTAVITRGERSNNDQVSEAGARTVAQITPPTRKLILDKYGIDPYLSPENAVESAGLLLKEGLQRNGGDSKLAVAEYHGGTDRANWGPRTASYVQRVTGGPPPAAAPSADAPAATAKPSTPGAMPDGSQSTFDRLTAAAAPPPTSSIQNIFAAYSAGKMSPDQAQAFEADVNSGKLLLPRGAALNGANGAPDTNSPAANIVTAYNARRMSPDQSAALEKDVQSGAFKMPPGMALNLPGTAAGIPGAELGVTGPVVPTPKPGLIDQAIGTGEAAANLVTGATAGLAGGAMGLVQDVNDLAAGRTPQPGNIERGMQALTYAPRTASGQDQAEVVGNVMQNLGAVAPMTAELAGLGRGAAPVLRGAGDVAREVPAAVRDAAAPVVERVRAAMPGATEPTPAPGTMGSVGAAAVDMATQRRAAAADLPVPVELTKGQADRSFEQQQFERETAKTPDAGAPLRDRFAQQNENVLKNFDAFVDQTGAEATNLRQVGATVDTALQKQFAADKAKVRIAYKNAEKAGEMEAPVSLDNLVTHLNESAPDAATAPILDVARKRAVRLGIATEGADGELVPAQVPLKIAETMRQAIGRATDFEPTNVRQAAIMKGLIDDSTEGAGGTLYAAARKERARLAQNYENRAVVNKLITMKRGTADRNVALEDVFSHSILDGSLDDVRNVRRVLQRSGDDGAQGWRELQGQTVQYLKSEATKNVARDIRGNEIVSASGLDRAIKKLDADGKLDFIFGRRGAEQLRTMNALAKDIYTSPPGSVNTSNTASILLAALDMSLSGVVGLPLPVASGVRILASRIKDRRLAARVNEALGGMKSAPKPALRPAPRPMTSPAATSRN